MQIQNLSEERFPMKNSTIRSKFYNSIIKLAAIFFWLLIWHVISATVDMQILLPSPILVFKKLVQLASTERYWISVSLSFAKIIFGILSGTVIALIFAILTAKVNIFNHLFSLPLNVIKSTPVASFIIMALVWVKSASLAAFVTAVMVLPIVWSNMHEGISTVDTKLIEVGKCYNFTYKKTVRYIYLPHIRPFFVSAITSAAGLGWKAGIAAEVIASPKNAIGAYLNDAKVYLETEEMFAWTITIIFLSIAVQYLLKFLTQRYLGRGRV